MKQIENVTSLLSSRFQGLIPDRDAASWCAAAGRTAAGRGGHFRRARPSGASEWAGRWIRLSPPRWWEASNFGVSVWVGT